MLFSKNWCQRVVFRCTALYNSNIGSSLRRKGGSHSFFLTMRGGKMRGKMKSKIRRKRTIRKVREAKVWPQFKKGYLKAIEKLFRKTNPGLLEIVHAIDKGSSNHMQTKQAQKRKNKTQTRRTEICHCLVS